MSIDDMHRPAGRPAACAVLTISDTRSEATDTAGAAIRQLLAEAGHTIVDHGIVADEPREIVAIVSDWTSRPGVDLVITTGGTGVAQRDKTVDALAALFETALPGFGEIFRHLSFEAVGPAAMLSRATAGIVGRTAVFVLPGSEQAVRLAMARLILPQIGHLVRELTK
jgi:molybdenum cofactor biosynthesis protein B